MKSQSVSIHEFKKQLSVSLSDLKPIKKKLEVTLSRQSAAGESWGALMNVEVALNHYQQTCHRPDWIRRFAQADKHLFERLACALGEQHSEANSIFVAYSQALRVKGVEERRAAFSPREGRLPDAVCLDSVRVCSRG